ncbi:MAG: hypothetical protein MUE75_01070 [Algoriphagus sp.]|nr:hypothetical protein [Algoriphagus sp.]
MVDKIWGNSRIKDTLIAGLISYAGFGTFFPKLVNGFASLNGTSDFETLTWFGMGYFLLPAFLFLAYWNGYEFRNVIADKLKPDNPIPSIGLDATILFVIVKLIPVYLFFVDPYLLYNASYVWVVIYATIGVFEFLVYCNNLKVGIIKQVTSFEVEEKRIFAEMLQYGLLISFLNLFLGIGMLYFVEPWYLYRDDMIVWLCLALLVYAGLVYVIYLVFSYKYHIQRPRNIFNIFPLFLFVLLIYVLPHVNRSFFPCVLGGCKGYQKDMLFLGCVFILILLIKNVIEFLIAKKEKVKFEVFSNLTVWKIFYILVFLFVLASVPYLLKEPLENTSRNYFEKRVKAANEITDKKLIPMIHTEKGNLSENDRDLFRFVHRNNHFLRLYWDWNNWQVNDTVKSEGGVLCEEVLYDIPKGNMKKLSSNFHAFTSARNFYYGQYDKGKWESRDPKSINEFYSDLFIHLKFTVFPNTIIPLANDSSLKDISNFYTHPLNYYSYVVNHYSRQVSKVDSVIHNLKYIEYLNRIDSTQDGRTRILGKGTNALRKAELVEDVQHILKGITEFMYQNSELSDSDILTSPPVKGFEYFKNMKQEEFFDRIRSAQVIYQSYLYDYQRIGVFLFLLQLVVLGFTWYRIKQDFVPPKKESSQHEQTSNIIPEAKSEEKTQKAEDHAVAVAFIVVLALLFPLMREIKAQNIDPQKKFWMLNLSNWYMPGFVLPELPPLEKLEEEKKKEEEKTESYPQFENFTLYYNDVRLDSNSYHDSLTKIKLDKAIKVLEELREKVSK